MEFRITNPDTSHRCNNLDSAGRPWNIKSSNILQQIRKQNQSEFVTSLVTRAAGLIIKRINLTQSHRPVSLWASILKFQFIREINWRFWKLLLTEKLKKM